MKDSNPNGDGMGLSLSKLAELPEDVQGCVPAYYRMGLAVVPNEGKIPLLEGWPSRHLTEDEIPLLFGNGENVGLLNGEPSGGLVTVDMDVPEALKITDRYLIETTKSGREGTPGAHVWYSSPGAKTRKWLDVDGTVLLEVRSDGCQTLAPPSVHPCGERYLWDRDGVSKPADVAPEELERLCMDLAIATILARHMPPIGGRHEYAKAAIGVLMRRCGKEDALKLVRAAWHAAEADSPDALRPGWYRPGHRAQAGGGR